MTFHIGSQQNGTFNNVAGDQTISGGQSTSVGLPPDVLAALVQLQSLAGSLPLPPAVLAQVTADVADLDGHLAADEHGRSRAAAVLKRVVDAARGAGVVVTALQGMGAAVATLARFLGPLGSSVLQLLG